MSKILRFALLSAFLASAPFAAFAATADEVDAVCFDCVSDGMGGVDCVEDESGWATCVDLGSSCYVQTFCVGE